MIKEISFKDTVDDAFQSVHVGQKRYDGTPYVVHPVRVKNRLGAKMGNTYTDEELVALFHDAIENAKTDKTRFRIKDKIKELFKNRPNVVDAISYLTKDDGDYIDYMKHIFIEKLPNPHAQELAKKIKIYDIIDNATDNPHAKQYLKYKNAIQTLYKMGAKFPKNLIDLFSKDLYLEYILAEAEPKESPEADSAPPAGGDDAPAPDAGGGDAGGNPFGDAAPDASGGDAGGNPFGDSAPDAGGGDMGGDTGGNPFGDGGGGDMGAGGDMGGEAGSEDGSEPSEDEKKKILYYNNKLKTIKNVIDQRNVEEPGMDFQHYNEFIKKNYISMTKKGSLMLPGSNDIKQSRLFIDKVIIPYLTKYVENYTKNNKKFTVLTNLDDNLFKYINQKSNLNLKYTNWSNEYTDSIYKDVKEKTGSDESSIKAAMYVFNVTNGKKLKRDGGEIDDILTKWEIGPTATKEDMFKIIYPEQYNQVQNEVSFIIKVYLSVLRKEFIKQLLKNEMSGIRTIAIVDKYTAWMLNGTFKNANKLIKDIKDKKSQAKEDAKEKSKSKETEKQPESKDKDDAASNEAPDKTADTVKSPDEGKEKSTKKSNSPNPFA